MTVGRSVFSAFISFSLIYLIWVTIMSNWSLRISTLVAASKCWGCLRFSSHPHFSILGQTRLTPCTKGSQNQDHCINLETWLRSPAMDYICAIQWNRKKEKSPCQQSPQTSAYMNCLSKSNKHLSALWMVFIFYWGDQVKMEKTHFAELIDGYVRGKKGERITKQHQKDLRDTEQISSRCFFNW